MSGEEFVERLIQLRIEKGASARDMSLSLGQNPGYINNIESGKALPSMSVFFYICDYFQIEPQDFFDRKNKHPEKLDEIINDLKYLSNDQLGNIAAIIKGLKNNSG